MIFTVRDTVGWFIRFTYSSLPETDSDIPQFLSWRSQPYMSCVGFLWEYEHFTKQILKEERNSKQIDYSIEKNIFIENTS